MTATHTSPAVGVADQLTQLADESNRPILNCGSLCRSFGALSASCHVALSLSVRSRDHDSTSAQSVTQLHRNRLGSTDHGLPISVPY